MFDLFGDSRSINKSPSSREDRNSTNSSQTFLMSWDIDRKDLIRQANSISLVNIFKHYRIKLDELNKKICCPFKSHKNGRESTPSFNFYPETNSYYCFGCKKGNRPCDFVSEIENIDVFKAAAKILYLFGTDLNLEDIEIIDRQNYSEKLDIMLKFSEAIRNFRKEHINNESEKFIERLCKIYDDLNEKHELTNKALELVVNKLLEKINRYMT